MQQKPDIFDRIMHLCLFRFAEPFYKKYKEGLLYLFFGGLTFVLSIATFGLFHVSWGINELVANILSWILAVLFAYATNKTWVFSSQTETMAELLKELASFFGGRIVTLLLEEAILLIFITKLAFPSMLVKIVAQVIVIVSNYVISKLFVFKAGVAKQK